MNRSLAPLLILLACAGPLSARPMARAEAAASPSPDSPRQDDPDARGASWLTAPRAWALAAAVGAVTVAGVFLWSTSGAQEGKAAPPDLGRPPGDPVTPGAN